MQIALGLNDELWDWYRDEIKASTSKAEIESLVRRCYREDDFDWLDRSSLYAIARMRLETPVCEL